MTGLPNFRARRLSGFRRPCSRHIEGITLFLQGGQEYERAMTSPVFRGFLAVLLLIFGTALLGADQASSRTRTKAKRAEKSEQSNRESADAKTAGKPSQVASYGDWAVFVAQGEKSKTCYTLATPKERTPSGLKRDPAYVFIADRPGENVREEVSVIMGFSVKEGGVARAEIGGAGFDLIAKGANAWIKNQAEERQLVNALKKGSKLIIKAQSLKGHMTTDSYSLTGLSQALEKVEKVCS
jgi:invasion protein IalB